MTLSVILAATFAASWTAEDLAALRKEFHAGGPGALVVRSGGKVLAEWGDVDRPRNVRSIRKSIVSALIGQEVAAGRLKLTSTLAGLGIDELTPLTAEEKRATLADLLTSRSGVYLPAAYELPSNAQRRPARGSHAPGSFFYYNNWDFNALGTIFERSAKADLFAEFASRIAEPLGMQDFRREHTQRRNEELSLHPAHLFGLSPRDLSRFAQMYLQRGEWEGRTIVPREWVSESTRAHVSNADGGYGYLWWIYPQGERNPTSAFAARGAGGQMAVVVPEYQLVFVFTQEPPLGGPSADLSKLDVGRGWRLLRSLTAKRR